MENSGFIKLHRSMTEWEWFNDIPTYILFTKLLFLVNWKDKKWRGQIVKRGEVITSIINLSKLTNLTIKQVRRALKNLQITGEIEVETTNKYSKIKIVNYSKYQDNSSKKDKQKTDYNTDKQYDTDENENSKDKQKANKGQTKGKQRATTKEYKEYKEVKNIYIIVRNFYNEICTSLPKCTKVSERRKKLIDARLRNYTVDDIKKVFELANESDFLSGRNGRWNGCNFDWLLNTNNFLKVIEGTYSNDKNKKIVGDNGVELLPESERDHSLDDVF